MNRLKKFNRKFLIIIPVLFVSCAYFNTFFNAQERYKEAFKAQQNSKSKTVAGNVKKNFDSVIMKCWKLIDVYGDSSEYADDALLLIGKSYYNIQDFPKAQRVLEQFILKYSQSVLLADAKLWLARTFLAQENEEDALKILNHIFESKVKTDIAAEAFYILGDLYFNKEQYDLSIENLNRCVDIVSDEEIFANAQFLLGDAYSKLGQHENAILHYQKLKGLDIPQLQEFQASDKIVDALIALKKYDEAEIDLKKMLRYQKFKPQFSLIETKLGERYREEGDIEFARSHFEDIFKKYPKSEGATLSSYYLAQLYEFNFVQFDSAQKYYNLVKNLNSYPDIVDDALNKNTLFKEYLKIRDQLRKDRTDLTSLARGDSTLIDSVTIAADSLETESDKMSSVFDLNNSSEKELGLDNNLQAEFDKADTLQSGEQRSESIEDDHSNIEKIVQPKKKAVSRSAEQVQNSYVKNSFAKAEFFLLKYENSDSAECSYTKFIQEFSDSALTPKAYYSLYYIYTNKGSDSEKSDSLRNIILSNYPDSPYSYKILGKENEIVKQTENMDDDTLNPLFFQAEKLRDNKDFKKAIKIFQEIADTDSGSTAAQKSRYYSAYIFEHDLADIPRAVSEYTKLAKEYPGTQYAKIAQNKIKEPPPDKAAEPEENILEEQPEKINVEENVSPEKQIKQIDEEGLKEIRRTDLKNDE